MNTTVEALKALYVAMGGTADDVSDITLIPDMINEIADLKSTDPDSNLVSEYSYAGHLDHYYIDGVLDQTTEHNSRAWLYEYDENDPDGYGHGNLISENSGTLTSGEQYIFEVEPEEDFEVDSIKLVDGSGNVLQDNLSNNTAFTLNNVNADSIYADIKCVGTSNNNMEHECMYAGDAHNSAGLTTKLFEYNDSLNTTGERIVPHDNLYEGMQYIISISYDSSLYNIDSISLVDYAGNVLQSGITNNTAFTLSSTAFAADDVYILVEASDVDPEPEPNHYSIGNVRVNTSIEGEDFTPDVYIYDEEGEPVVEMINGQTYSIEADPMSPGVVVEELALFDANFETLLQGDISNLEQFTLNVDYEGDELVLLVYIEEENGEVPPDDDDDEPPYIPPFAGGA